MTAQQLKNSILQMAVQGKLVPQDPSDEPASALLDRIRAEKAEMVKEGKIKKEKNPSVIFRGDDGLFYEKIGNQTPVCIEDELPFDIPESWEWVRICSLGEIIRGNGIKRSEIMAEGCPCVRYGELYTTYQISFIEAVSFIPAEIDKKCKHIGYGDILITLTGENKPDIAKAVTYLGNESIAIGGDLAYWSKHGLNPLFISYVFASPYVIGCKEDLATGDIIVHISVEKIGGILFPVPPLEEQDRIVKIIKDFIPYMEDYERKESLLSKLSEDFPEQLKKSILQFAVEGKLVPQDPSDEPASALLERIRVEKEQLIESGKIKRDKHESVIYRRDDSYYEKVDGVERCIDDEIPFEIPESWEWVTLKLVAVSALGKTLNKSTDTGKYYPYLCSINIYWCGVDLTNVKQARFEESELEKYRLKQGDLLVCEGGDIGRAAVWDFDDEMFYQNALHRIRFYGGILPEYFKLLLECYKGNGILERYSKGETIKHLVQKTLNAIYFPLPPLAEQKRIVEKLSSVNEKIKCL